MWTLNWESYYYQPVTCIDTGLQIGNLQIDGDGLLIFRDKHDGISFDDLMSSVLQLEKLTFNTCRSQLAYHVFATTHRPKLLESYFPITKSLSKEAQHQFHEVTRNVMLHPGFDLQLRDRGRNNLIQKLPAVAYLVAGHMVELFFFRQDILERLLNSKIHILLYTDQESFKADGGVAGGCYNPQRGCVQLVVSRLFEGFNQPTPGVFPFLHEFGHLLDFFDAGTVKHELTSSGWLPGMRSTDGDIYSPEARDAFIKGKRLEMERYARQVANPNGADPLPIGHPYVFQTNSEFIAGYLEMFFRNPHYFAAQNPDLFHSFVRLLRQDPRPYWEADFPFYIEQNRAFYQSGQRPNASGLKLEVD